MNKSKNLSVNDAYDLFIRKCRVKNLSQASIVSYENKIHPFVDYCEGGLISAVTIDTVDGFTNHLKTEHNVNDVSVVSYLRSVRAFLYYCMECNYMTSFKIHLPKAQKDIKETYSNEQLEKLLAKPDLNSCSFTEFKTWVFENYMLATGNRLSTALNVHTPSSIKYCKFGDTENWFYDWLKQISKKNIPFGIVKYEKPTKYFGGKLVRTHYQILNTLQITKNKITELLQQTLDYIELLRKDPLAMYHYCEATSDDEDSDLMMNVKADVIYRMMKLNMSFKDTKLYKHLAKNVIESIRADIKCGRILVNGNYSTVLGNPIEMLQESIGKYEPETTIVGKGNIISTAFPQKQLLACRSPHITMGNIYLPHNTENHLVTTYINMTDNIMVINSVGENVLQRANSMDFDSDQMMIVDNDIMIDAAVKNYDKFLVPTTDIEPDPKEEEYTAMTVEGTEKALHKILRKPDIKSRDVDKDKIKAVLELCKQRAKDDKKLGVEKTQLGKSEYNRMRKQTIENFLEDLAEIKMNQATLYTLLTSKDAEKHEDYILQGLLELKSSTLKKLVKTDDTTPTLVEDAAGDIEIYGIKHKKSEVA